MCVPKTVRLTAKERLDRFFREDVRDLEALRDLSSIEILADLVAERVASPLSLNALREDLEVSHRAVTHWVDILERAEDSLRLSGGPGEPARFRRTGRAVRTGGRVALGLDLRVAPSAINGWLKVGVVARHLHDRGAQIRLLKNAA